MISTELTTQYALRNTFSLSCPLCRGHVIAEENRARCLLCGTIYPRTNDIWRFLPSARQEFFAPFLQEYRATRANEKWESMDGEYYRALPIVPHDDPHRAIWKIRAKHFARLLQMLGDAKNLRVLDIGAGNGWLSNQLAAREHSVAAVDLNDDRRDGLGARVNYANAFECYQAEFDCLPFSDAQFDFVIFNASLHYASSLTSSLAESQRVLAPRGSIIILDSPFYTRPAVKNFLTLQLLRDAAHELNLEMLLAFADDVWHKLARRKIIELKIGREPAHFPIIRLFQPPTSNI